MIQPGLFEAAAEDEKVIEALFYALGEFQSRKKVLADRELAFDRLRGAFRRAFEKFGIDEPSDDRIADALGQLGANVKRLPSFVAKHPFRVTVPGKVANDAFERFLGAESDPK